VVGGAIPITTCRSCFGRLMRYAERLRVRTYRRRSCRRRSHGWGREGTVGSAIAGAIDVVVWTLRGGREQLARAGDISSVIRLLAIAPLDLIVFPVEGGGAVSERDQPAVGDGDAMRIACQISHNGLGPAEGPLGVMTHSALRNGARNAANASRASILA
jgi:hypothetical protein